VNQKSPGLFADLIAGRCARRFRAGRLIGIPSIRLVVPLDVPLEYIAAILGIPAAVVCFQRDIYEVQVFRGQLVNDADDFIMGPCIPAVMARRSWPNSAAKCRGLLRHSSSSAGGAGR